MEKKFRVYYCQYELYTVFMNGDKAYTRRLYKVDDNTYKFRFNNKWNYVKKENTYF